MEKTAEDVARTSISSLGTEINGAGTIVEVTLENDGETKLEDFDEWDVIVQYHEVGSSSEVFSDSFETQTLDNWTQDAQNDWDVMDTEARGGTYSAHVDDADAGDATLTLKDAIDLSQGGGTIGDTLTFSWWIDSTFDTTEYLALDLWNGASWVEVDRLEGDVDTEDTWHDESVDLASYRVSDFKLRFRGTMNEPDEDAYVDLVIITAFPVTDYHIERLAYKDGTPGNNEWTVEGIYLDADTSEAEIFEPGIFNPNEEMIVQMKINPAAGEGTTNLATIATPNGISISATFNGPS